MPIQTYQDLKVWQEGIALAEACYKLTKEFPPEELYGLTSQIRRATVSIPANIAEGYGRESRKEYVRFLKIAQGSLKELETHLILSERVSLASSEQIQPFLDNCGLLGRMLRKLIRSLETSS